MSTFCGDGFGQGRRTKPCSIAKERHAGRNTLQPNDRQKRKNSQFRTLLTGAKDVARLAARHHSAQRLLDDSRKMLGKSESEATRAREAAQGAKEAELRAAQEFETAQLAETEVQHIAEEAELALNAALAGTDIPESQWQGRGRGNLASLELEQLQGSHSPVAAGQFGADMQVSLVNDGPVTFLLQS